MTRKSSFPTQFIPMQIGGTEYYNMANEHNEPMNEEMEYQPELYTLVDENGTEKVFELVDVLEENERVYFALIPHVENPEELLEDECELVVLWVDTDENGNDILIPIESDEEYERIANIFIERFECDCDCDDDDCDCGCGCDCHEE